MILAFLCFLIILDNSDQEKDTKAMKGISKGCCYDRTCRFIGETHRQRNKSIQRKTNLMNFFRTYIWHVYQSVSYCCDKISGKTNLKKEGFLLAYCLREQSTVVRELWWQELEVAAHSTSIGRKAKMMMNVGVHLGFCPLSSLTLKILELAHVKICLR